MLSLLISLIVRGWALVAGVTVSDFICGTPGNTITATQVLQDTATAVASAVVNATVSCFASALPFHVSTSILPLKDYALNLVEWIMH